MECLRVSGGNRASLLLLAILLTGQLVAAWQSAAWILSYLTFDDTYLLLRVAQQWADVGYPSFDGIHRTNGFQAAWGILVWLLAQFAHNHLMLLHLALTLAAGLNTLTGVLLWQFARRLAPGDHTGLWVVAFWTAFCLTSRPSQCGLENALVGVCVASGLLTWRLLDSSRRGDANWRPRSGVLLLAALTGLGV